MITNTMKVIEETRGKINPIYDMWIKNAQDIVNRASNQYEMIVDSFVFGYAQGMKAAKAEMKNR